MPLVHTPLLHDVWDNIRHAGTTCQRITDHIVCGSLAAFLPTVHTARSEQVWEEWLLEECLKEDEAGEAQHGNAACGHLKLQGRKQDSSSNSTAIEVRSTLDQSKSGTAEVQVQTSASAACNWLLPSYIWRILSVTAAIT